MLPLLAFVWRPAVSFFCRLYGRHSVMLGVALVRRPSVSLLVAFTAALGCARVGFVRRLSAVVGVFEYWFDVYDGGSVDGFQVADLYA